MGTSSTTSSNSSTVNTGSNYNATSVSQPINPVYNLNVSQSLPVPENTNLAGVLTKGIINTNSENSTGINIPLLIIGGIILILIIYFIIK